MKTKMFDCVEMKRRGAAEIHEETKEMTREEELAYWRKQDEELHAVQQRMVEKQAAEPSGTA